MFRKDPKPINAVDALAQRDAEAGVDGERSAAELVGGGRRAPVGQKPLLIIAGALVVGLGGVYAAKSLGSKDGGAEAKKPAQQQQVAKNSKKAFEAAPPSGQVAAGDALDAEVDPAALDGGVLIDGGGSGPGPATPPGYVPEMTGGATGGSPPVSVPPEPKPPTPAQIAHERRLKGGLGGRDGAPMPVADSGPPAAQQRDEQAPGELGRSLTPIRLSAQAAGKLSNRDYLLTQGAMLDCVLETKIVSSVAGMTSCHLTRDIYSSNGRVVVLDRGSKVVGFYQGEMKRGQPRIFVQWSRVETPKGVVINLDSPGAGPLGEGGVGGYIDNHFGQRFGGAILLSLVDDLGDYFANKANGQSRQDIQFSNTGEASKEMARVALESSVNIPPTLYKNQGERIAIFVARDLNFQGVYSLARR
jgi:type IV secretion system protein VirB10